MKIEIAYTGKTRQSLVGVNVAEGATIEAAITASGILHQFPEIDLASQKVGIFGKVKTLSTPLKQGDRIEIYRPAVAKRQEEEADSE